MTSKPDPAGGMSIAQVRIQQIGKPTTPIFIETTTTAIIQSKY